jgi:hypothetical protein
MQNFTVGFILLLTIAGAQVQEEQCSDGKCSDVPDETVLIQAKIAKVAANKEEAALQPGAIEEDETVQRRIMGFGLGFEKIFATTSKKSNRCAQYGPWATTADLYAYIYANVAGIMSSGCQAGMMTYVQAPGCEQKNADFQTCENKVTTTMGLKCAAGKEAMCQQLASAPGLKDMMGTSSATGIGCTYSGCANQKDLTAYAKFKAGYMDWYTCHAVEEAVGFDQIPDYANLEITVGASMQCPTEASEGAAPLR